jgi:hypothetical protein
MAPVAVLDLVEQAGVLQGHGKAGSERLQELDIRRRESPFPLDVLKADRPGNIVVAEQRHRQHRFGRLPGHCGRAGLGHDPLQILIGEVGFFLLDEILNNGVERLRLDRVALSLFDHILIMDQAVGEVETGDGDHLGVEDLSDLVPDQVVDRPDVELGHQPGLDGVDQRQFGASALGFVEQAHVLDGNHGLVGEALQQGDLVFLEQLRLVIANQDVADRPVLAHQRCRNGRTVAVLSGDRITQRKF